MKKKKFLILHIGLPKTGSTSIQHLLLDNFKKNLIKKYIFFNKNKNPVQITSNVILKLFAKNKFKKQEYLNINTSQNYLKSLLKKELSFFIMSSYETGIITSEFLYNLPNKSVIFLKRYLRKWNIEIISFIACARDPIGRIISSYQQNIIKGYDDKLIDHIKKRINKETKLIDKIYTNYQNENLKFLIYNKSSLIDDFFNLIEENPHQIIYKNSSSVPYEYLMYLRKYNNKKFKSSIVHKIFLRIIFFTLCVYYFKIFFWKNNKVRINNIFMEIYNKQFLNFLPRKGKNYTNQTKILDLPIYKKINYAQNKYNQFLIKNDFSDKAIQDCGKIEIPFDSINLDQIDCKKIMRLKLLQNFILYFFSILRIAKKLKNIIKYENN